MRRTRGSEPCRTLSPRACQCREFVTPVLRVSSSGISTINRESGALISEVVSGDGDDTITGTFLEDTIYGGHGTDTISSLSGNDAIDVVQGEVDHVDCGLDLFGSQDHDSVYLDFIDVVIG